MENDGNEQESIAHANVNTGSMATDGNAQQSIENHPYPAIDCIGTSRLN